MKLQKILEGFSDYSIQGSDSAGDLWYVIESDLESLLIKKLTLALKDKGNAYNTSGLENVSMILVEKHKLLSSIRLGQRFSDFALDIANQLESKINSKVDGDSIPSVYKKWLSFIKSNY